jgi:hypothetical protein
MADFFVFPPQIMQEDLSESMLLPKGAILTVPRQVSMCARRKGVREGKNRYKIIWSQKSIQFCNTAWETGQC